MAYMLDEDPTRAPDLSLPTLVVAMSDDSGFNDELAELELEDGMDDASSLGDDAGGPTPGTGLDTVDEAETDSAGSSALGDRVQGKGAGSVSSASSTGARSAHVHHHHHHHHAGSVDTDTRVRAESEAEAAAAAKQSPAAGEGEDDAGGAAAGAGGDAGTGTKRKHHHHHHHHHHHVADITRKVSKTANQLARKGSSHVRESMQHTRDVMKQQAKALRVRGNLVRTRIKRTTSYVTRGVWNPPRLVLDWNTRDKHERRPTWFELFVDLLYVGACIKLSTFLKHEINVMGMLWHLLFVYTLWGTWIDQQSYSTRFATKDSAHRIFNYFTVVGVLLMVAAIPESTHAEDADAVVPVYCVGLLIFRATTLVMNWELYKFIERSQFMVKHVVVGNLVGVPFLIAGIFVNAAWSMGCIAVAHFLGYIVFRKQAKAPEEMRLPVHVEHFAERHGLLIMLCMGEVIISLVLPELVVDFAHIAALLCGLTCVFLIQQVYFESQPARVADHALRISMKGSLIFIHAHWMLFATLIAMGTGVKVLLLHSGQEIHPPEAWLICGAMSATLLLVIAVRYSHAKGFASTLGGGGVDGGDPTGVWVKRIVVALAPLAVVIPVYFHAVAGEGILAMCAACCFYMAWIDTFARRKSACKAYLAMVARANRTLSVDATAAAKAAAAAAAPAVAADDAATGSSKPPASDGADAPEVASASAAKEEEDTTEPASVAVEVADVPADTTGTEAAAAADNDAPKHVDAGAPAVVTT